MKRTSFDRYACASLGIALLALAPSARAQCPQFATEFDPPGSDATVDAFCVFDDGSGPALYVGGSFNGIGSVGTSGIALWDGATWSDVGGGLNEMTIPPDTFTTIKRIHALATYDDGSGPALFAAGSFQRIGGILASNVARWDGHVWTPLGAGVSSTATTLCVYDDGSGPALYVGGTFAHAGAVAANGIAKWDGTSWSSLGSGATGTVWTLAVYDDLLGGGAVLVAGGTFTTMDAVGASNIARWDGASWSSFGSGMNATVNALGVFDLDGSGGNSPRLYAAGGFTVAGGASVHGVAQWNGTAWAQFSAGPQYIFGGYVRSMLVHDDGSGAALYVTGRFSSFSGTSANNVARWKPTAWSSLASGVDGQSGFTTTAGPMIAFDDGSGPALYVGGNFDRAGGVSALDLAKWDGAQWSQVGSTLGLRHAVRSFAEFDDGTGPALYVGGGFADAAGTPVNHIAKWTGTQWSPLGTGLVPYTFLPREVTASDMSVYDDGSGPALYVCGSLVAAGGQPARYIARWNGAAWSNVGDGFPSAAYALAVYDDGVGNGPALFAAGSMHKLFRWDGTSWTTPEGVSGIVQALAVHDDGTGNGPELYVAGSYANLGPVQVNNVGKWRSGACGPCGSTLAGGMNGSVVALSVFDEQRSGDPQLVAGGGFTIAGGVAAENVARWNGHAWLPMGEGLPGFVTALVVFDEGAGAAPVLYAAGQRALPARAYLARWDGAHWTQVGGDWTGTFATTHSPGVARLFATRAGADGRAHLWAGGVFMSAGGTPAWNVADLAGCPSSPGTAFCFGDGSMLTPCPCAPPDAVPNPSGGVDGGCANALHLDGGQLAASGATNPDCVVLRATRLAPFGFAFFVAGDGAQPDGFASGDGLRCSDGALVRFGARNAVHGEVRYPDSPQELPLHDVAAVAPGTGVTTYFQVVYRDTAPGFCNASTFNLTNAYQITWN
ncbi:MAG: hypothetical protein ACKVWV_18510 [Planctomycetota bacterium]